MIVLAAGAHVASAEGPNKKALARELFELGIDEYKSKDYAAAAASMGKAYELDPEPEALYALAQAERLSGDCKGATEHYQKLLDLAKDDKTVNAVTANLALCKQIERGEKPKVDEADAKEIEKRDAPTIQIRTIYRTERKSDRLAIACFAIGGTAIGGAATAYLLGVSTRNDADHATTLAQYNKSYDRSVLLKDIAYGSAGLGVALVGLATYRVLTGGSKESRTPIAVVPTSGGSMLTWSGSW